MVGYGPDVTRCTSSFDGKQNIQSEDQHSEALFYEPPWFPSLEIPFLSCDLVSCSDLQQAYSPYSTLATDDGFPYIAASLQSGDLVIGKVAESGADHSIKLKHT